MCYMHLDISGRCSRRAARDGLVSFRLMSRCINDAQLHGLDPCLLTSKLHFIHTVLPTLLTYLRPFAFFRRCLHWSSFPRQSCSTGRTMASTPSVKGNDVVMTVSPSYSTSDQKDQLALARLGKKAVLKVGN